MAEWFRRSAEKIITYDKREIAEGTWIKCPKCRAVLYHKQLDENNHVCTSCSHHFRMRSNHYIQLLFGENQIEEIGGNIKPKDTLEFNAAKSYIDQIKNWRLEGMGYQAIQGSRPQTLAYALSDSPAGLAAWICEKFYEWTDCKGAPENSMSFDKMLANICLYWFSGAIGSSFWPYYARNHRPWFIPEGKTISVPVGYAEFPKEMLRPKKLLAEKQQTIL